MRFPFLTGERLRPKASHLLLGARGEVIACAYLRSIGYAVRGRNIRLGKDEIDVLAWDPTDEVLVFVEVKTRAKEAGDGYHPEKTAGARKRQALRRAARRWVASEGFDGGYRIDLLCVERGRVTHHFKELSWE